jgi:hypothetical protein
MAREIPRTTDAAGAFSRFGDPQPESHLSFRILRLLFRPVIVLAFNGSGHSLGPGILLASLFRWFDANFFRVVFGLFRLSRGYSF